GPMDPHAHRLANALAGNGSAVAALEITLVGPELELDEDRTIAIAGAAFEIAAGDRRIPMLTAGRPPGRARLPFGRPLRRARAYLAIEGGVETVSVLGSRASHLTIGMGGFHGRALKAGDRLPLGPVKAGHRKSEYNGKPGQHGRLGHYDQSPANRLRQGFGG